MITGKFLLFSLLNLASCVYSEKSEVNKDNSIVVDVPTFCFTYVSEEEFVLAKKVYVEKLLKDTIDIGKQNGQLKLPLSIGDKLFQDSISGIEDENRREFDYLGQFKEVDFYVVSATYWEQFEVYLIDKKSGNSYAIWSVPRLSPDNTKIATILSFGLEGQPVGIQILSINKNNYSQIEKLLEIDQNFWIPVDFVWENNSSIILKTIVFNDFPEGKESEKFGYLRLKFD